MTSVPLPKLHSDGKCGLQSYWKVDYPYVFVESGHEFSTVQDMKEFIHYLSIIQVPASLTRVQPNLRAVLRCESPALLFPMRKPQQWMLHHWDYLKWMLYRRDHPLINGIYGLATAGGAVV